MAGCSLRFCNPARGPNGIQALLVGGHFDSQLGVGGWAHRQRKHTFWTSNHGLWAEETFGIASWGQRRCGSGSRRLKLHTSWVVLRDWGWWFSNSASEDTLFACKLDQLELLLQSNYFCLLPDHWGEMLIPWFCKFMFKYIGCYKMTSIKTLHQWLL